MQYKLIGRSARGTVYIGHTTDSIASALGKFTRWRYRELSQRQRDQFFNDILTHHALKGDRFKFHDFTLELMHIRDNASRRR
jgi:hypothetical protein